MPYCRVIGPDRADRAKRSNRFGGKAKRIKLHRRTEAVGAAVCQTLPARWLALRMIGLRVDEETCERKCHTCEATSNPSVGREAFLCQIKMRITPPLPQ